MTEIRTTKRNETGTHKPLVGGSNLFAASFIFASIFFCLLLCLPSRVTHLEGVG